MTYTLYRPWTQHTRTTALLTVCYFGVKAEHKCQWSVLLQQDVLNLGVWSELGGGHFGCMGHSFVTPLVQNESSSVMCMYRTCPHPRLYYETCARLEWKYRLIRQQRKSINWTLLLQVHLKILEYFLKLIKKGFAIRKKKSMFIYTLDTWSRLL